MNQFPRLMGFPEKRLVSSFEEMLEQINRNNGKKNCYIGVYPCKEKEGKWDYSEVQIDRVFFDFDGAMAYENVCKLHKALLWAKTKHTVFFSGNGFHCYVFTQIIPLKNRRKAIEKYQRAVAKALQFSIGDPSFSDIDIHQVGRLTASGRVPYTRNLSSKLFCIPLPQNFHELGFSEVRRRAIIGEREPNYIYGEHLVNLTSYDSEESEEVSESSLIIEVESAEKVVENFPFCIKGLLSNPDLGFRGRYLVIVYLRDMAYTEGETVKILEKYLSSRKFRHCVYEETQVRDLFRKRNEFFVTVDEMKGQGACKGCQDCQILKLYRW